MDKKFKRVLKETVLNDKESVKEYLKISFRKRLPQKDFKLYINICKIYDKYPDTIQELLNNIPTLGYYKDYFFIYSFARNDKIKDYIVKLVIKQINMDLANLKLKQQISTLGKWLPRESSKLNHNGFQDHFCQLFYPVIAKDTARRRYRKLKTMLNKQLGTLESKLSTKDFEIDYNKVSPMALKMKKKALIENEMTKEKFEEHQMNTLKKMSLSDFSKELFETNYTLEQLHEAWIHNRYTIEIPFINKSIGHSVCVIDLSKDTFATNTQYFAIGIALLVDQFSMLKNKVIIGKNKVTLGGNIIDKANQLMTYCGPCILDTEKYYEMIKQENEEFKNIIFVSTKDITNHEALQEKKITLTQYIPDQDSYNIKYYNGSKIREFKKYIYHNQRDDVELLEKKKMMSDIIIESNELNDRLFPIITIAFFTSLWITAKFFEYY